MTPQQKIAERIYELLPHKKENIVHNIEQRINTITDEIENIKVDNGYGKQHIHLADILLAISMSLKNGDFLNCHVGSRNDLTIITQYALTDYDLEKDNILDQSDEFCEFLLELLK